MVFSSYDDWRLKFKVEYQKWRAPVNELFVKLKRSIQFVYDFLDNYVLRNSNNVSVLKTEPWQWYKSCFSMILFVYTIVYDNSSKAVISKMRISLCICSSNGNNVSKCEAMQISGLCLFQIETIIGGVKQWALVHVDDVYNYD